MRIVYDGDSFADYSAFVQQCLSRFGQKPLTEPSVDNHKVVSVNHLTIRDVAKHFADLFRLESDDPANIFGRIVDQTSADDR
jgi:hypothetical protein